MNLESEHAERRSAQRFAFQMPTAVHAVDSNRRGTAFTQDLSARGVLFCTDVPMSPGERVELTLVMPSEITLAESMKVCCRGRVLRVSSARHAKMEVAVRLEGYEFLPDEEKIVSPAAYHPDYDSQTDSAAATHVFEGRLSV